MHRPIPALLSVCMVSLLAACSDSTSDDAAPSAAIVEPNIVEPEIVEPVILEPVLNAPVLAKPKIANPFTRAEDAQPAITASHAKIRLPLGGRDVTGGYVTLVSTVDDALVGVTTPVAEAVELHNHIKDGDVMRMVQVTEIPLPAGQAVALKPGGLHMMLFGVDPTLAEGDQVTLTLTLASGAEIVTKAGVHARVEAVGEYHGGAGNGAGTHDAPQHPHHHRSQAQ